MALVHAIILNHPFTDGNKRTALYLLEAVINRIEYRLAVEDLVLYDLTSTVTSQMEIRKAGFPGK